MHQNELQATEERALSVKLQCLKRNVRKDATQMLK